MRVANAGEEQGEKGISWELRWATPQAGGDGERKQRCLSRPRGYPEFEAAKIADRLRTNTVIGFGVRPQRHALSTPHETRRRSTLLKSWKMDTRNEETRYFLSTQEFFF